MGPHIDTFEMDRQLQNKRSLKITHSTMLVMFPANDSTCRPKTKSKSDESLTSMLIEKRLIHKTLSRYRIVANCSSALKTQRDSLPVHLELI